MREADPLDEEVDDSKVCVVGATTAWPFYQLSAAYVCQENRYFQTDTGRLGFYSSRLIHGAAPRIIEIFPSISLDDATASALALHSHPILRRLGEVLDACMQHGWADPAVQVVLLSPIDDESTVRFEPVKHEGRSAWTMRQRYTRLDELLRAQTTEQLGTDAGGEP